MTRCATVAMNRDNRCRKLVGGVLVGRYIGECKCVVVVIDV